MTATNTPKEKAKSTASAFRGLGLCYMTVFVIILFFKNSDIAAKWVTNGLHVCTARLIPSIFPFTVISAVALEIGIGRLIPRTVKKLLGKIFGISGDGVTVIILGWLCGFPIGAKCAGNLYGNGNTDEEEYNRIICISSTPSPAFLIGAVGVGMLGSASAGVCLYAISVFSSVTVGVLQNRKKDGTHRAMRDAPTLEHIQFSKIFTRAVSESAAAMLNICAFVVFFSAFLGVLEQSLSFISLSETAKALLFGTFELTSGLTLISSLSSPSSFALCALAVGWSGLSVHFQTLYVCSDKPLKIRKYLSAHTLRAVICLILALMLSPLVL